LINPGAVNTRRTPYPELFLLGVFKKAVGVRGSWPLARWFICVPKKRDAAPLHIKWFLSRAF
jgi:hypothetical protein